MKAVLTGDDRLMFDAALTQHIALAATVQRDLGEPFARALSACCQAVQQGGKLLLFGNGGSASQAQHLATELVVRLKENRRALPAIALTADASILTAAANDFGFETIFARQIEALGRPGDVAIGISTSGTSPNVIAALRQARGQGLVTIGLGGGTGGHFASVCDATLLVPSADTALIQEMHLVLGHLLCRGIERTLPTV